MPSACHSEQLDEVEALQAIYHDEVEVLCDDEGLVALVVHIHPELAEGKLAIQADLNPDMDVSGLPALPGSFPSPAGGGYGSQPPTDIMELAKRKVTGDPSASAKPALARSESGKHTSHAEGEVKHLPPLRLQLKLPPDYPESSAPEFQLASSWLDSEILSELCRNLDQKWQEAEGSPIIFTWAEALRYEAPEALQFQSSTKPLALLLRAHDPDHPDPGMDPRARPECENCMQTLLDLLLYDKCRGLDIWKQQQHLCNICFSEYPGSQFVHLGECSHAFCKTCVSAMAEIHVTEGSISELLCPEPSCRADISASALGQVLEEEQYERWHALKLQRVLMSELKGVVFCPRCEETGRETPVLPDEEDDGNPPVARCGRCEYAFCAKCLGLYHGCDPCFHPEERTQQAAMRRLENSHGAAERRKLKREAERGYLIGVNDGDDLPSIDAAGYITEDQEPNMLEGDYVQAVHAGVPERITGSTLWDKQRDSICTLAEVLKDSPRPISIRLRRGSAIAATNRLRQRKLMEELLTLKEIARESQTCPNCSVRVHRSAGCNHMTCTQCRTHFCYRCGARLNAEDPYSHFRTGGCTTFDTEEVRRMALQQRDNNAQGFVDVELQRLREEFGDQGQLFAQFQARRVNAPRRGAEGRGNIAARLRLGEVQCPTCGQWNGRTGGLNHIRCGMCRSSYCGNCRRRIQGVITHHFRGENSCPQHAR